MKEIAEELSVFFNYSDNVSYENDDVNYSKIVNVFDSFENMHKMSKDDFLEKIFVGAFKLIPEAQKGSFFELVEDKYVPIFCNGYDMDVLRKLEFKREDAFIEYQCSDVSSIEAYEIYIERRDDSKYSEEMINIFKSLGTYNSYTSLYAPIQVEGVNVGIICFECFDKKSFSKDSKKVLKFYAQIISNFYAMKTFHEKKKRCTTI